MPQVYQDRTVENMARWNQEKRQHQAGSNFVEASNEGEDSEDAAAAGQDLLSNGLINVPEAKTRKGGAQKGEKRARKN